MRNHTCTACQTRIPTGEAVLRGNGHELLAFHRDCFTLYRATAGITVPVPAFA